MAGSTLLWLAEISNFFLPSRGSSFCPSSETSHYLSEVAKLSIIHQMAPKHYIPSIKLSTPSAKSPNHLRGWDVKAQLQVQVQEHLKFSLQLLRIFGVGFYQEREERENKTFLEKDHSLLVFPLYMLAKRLWWTLQNEEHEYSRGPSQFHSVFACFTILSSVLKICLLQNCWSQRIEYNNSLIKIIIEISVNKSMDPASWLNRRAKLTIFSHLKR